MEAVLCGERDTTINLSPTRGGGGACSSQSLPSPSSLLSDIAADTFAALLLLRPPLIAATAGAPPPPPLPPASFGAVAGVATVEAGARASGGGGLRLSAARNSLWFCASTSTVSAEVTQPLGQRDTEIQIQTQETHRVTAESGTSQARNSKLGDGKGWGLVGAGGRETYIIINGWDE